MALRRYLAPLDPGYYWPQVNELTRATFPAAIDVQVYETDDGVENAQILFPGAGTQPSDVELDAWRAAVLELVPPDPTEVADAAAIADDVEAAADAVADPTAAATVATLRGEVNETKAQLAAALDQIAELAGIVAALTE